MLRFSDALGRELTFATAPRRIVSLVPSLTEAICALGLEPQLFGVTKFCVHPAHIRGLKVVVGGTKNVHFDRIRALSPEIIIANKEENTLEMVSELETICPVWVTDVASMADNNKLLEDLGSVFNRRAEAAQWISRISSAQNEFLVATKDSPRRKTAYLIWRDPWMAAGSGTFIDSMMQFNKFKNVFTEPRYPGFGLEELRMHDPEVVLLSSEPYPFKDPHAFEIGRATHHAKVIFADGEMFSWYGTRPAKAFGYFTRLHEKLR